VSVCLCLSVTSWCSIELTVRIELVFDMEAYFDLSYTVLQGNLGISKNKGTSLWISGHRKFRHDRYIVEMCHELCSTKVDAQSMINWIVIGHLSGKYLSGPMLDHCSFITGDHQALSTA